MGTLRQTSWLAGTEGGLAFTCVHVVINAFADFANNLRHHHFYIRYCAFTVRDFIMIEDIMKSTNTAKMDFFNYQ